jgi:hypothetical protein
MASPELSNHATFSAHNFNVLCKPYMEDQKNTLFVWWIWTIREKEGLAFMCVSRMETIC